MKKLIPMMAVAAVAFGAFAATGHKETFNDLTAGDKLALNVNGGYWQGAEGVEATVVAGTTDQGNILDITDSTITNPLYFNYNELVGASESERTSAPQAIGQGLYLDTMVQFTVSSDLDQSGLTDDVKLAAWAYKSDDEGNEEDDAKLVLRAGYYNNGTLEAKNYTTEKTIDPEKWYRMTVKAMPICTVDKKTYYGFVVYVDGVAVAINEEVKSGDNPIVYTATAQKYADKNQLLPSRVAMGDAVATIRGCGFAGTGKVDDVELTDVAPDFAKDDLALALTLGDGVASVVVKVGDKEITGTDNVYTLPAGTETVTIEATPATGYVITSEGTCKADAGTFNVTAAKIAATVDGKAYTDLSEAIAAAIEAEKALVLAGNITGPIAVEAETGTLTIDLAGCTIAASESGDATIVSEIPVVIDDSSVGMTGVVAAAKDALAVGAPALTVNAGTIDGGIEADAINFNGGKILDVEYEADAFVVPTDKVAKLGEDGYWTVENAGPEPKPTFTLTIPTVDHATADKETGAVVEGTEVTINWTADTGYEIVEGYETQTITVTADVTAATPKVQATLYTITYVYTDGEAAVEGVENDNLTNYTIETDTITINTALISKDGYTVKSVDPETIEKGSTGNKTVTVTLEAAAQPLPGDDYMAEGEKTAYDEWAKATGVTAGDTDLAADLAVAFRLNVTGTETPADAIAAADAKATDLVKKIDLAKLASGEDALAAVKAELPAGLQAVLKPVEEIDTTASLFRLVIEPVNAN